MAVIFLVEDNDDVRDFLTDMLGALHEVRSFADGESAVGALTRCVPDVVVSDLELPGIDGEDVARIARVLSPRPRLVLMSGNHHRLQAAAVLADATVAKPHAIADILAAVGVARTGRARERASQPAVR